MADTQLRPTPLKGTALITGGAKRIGRAIALSLAARGYNIALHYHTSLKDAEETSREIHELGRQCALFRCDLSDMHQIRSLIPSVFQDHPNCNILVNNASIFEKAHFMETEEENLDRHLNINFKAPLFLTRDFAHHCQNGHVINMLDTRIVTTDSTHFAYTLSKRALFEFSRMAATELAPGIRVNAIAPGLILPPTGENESYVGKRIAAVPLKFKGDIEHIIGALNLFLDNPFITGDCLFVDGGEHLK